MQWEDTDFKEYDREVPCMNCGKPAKPTVAGNNLKCWECGHIFKEDGSKIEVECHCKKCNPCHDPLKGKTKGKKAELVLPDKKEKKVKKSKKTAKSNLKKFICDNCGEIETGLYDGYGVRERMLEGVMFPVTNKNGKITVTHDAADNDYLDDFNTKKIEAEIKAAVEDGGEWLECPKCGENFEYGETDLSDATEIVLKSPIDELFGK